MRDRILLLSLRKAMSALGKRGEEIRSLPMADSLVAMVEAAGGPLRRGARVDQASTKSRRLNSGSDEDLDFIREIRNSDSPAIDQLATLLIEGLFVKSLQKQVRWFWSTGGIRKPYGLITGTLQRPHAPGGTRPPTTCLKRSCSSPSPRQRQRASTAADCPSRTCSKLCANRFGILIDQPPAALDSADTRAAAAANLEAFKRRLRLLGCFDGLSDDFSAQYVRNPVEAA